MFFEEEFDFNIITDIHHVVRYEMDAGEITVDFLQEWCNENDIGLQIVDNATSWCAFAQYYGRKAGLDAFASASFGYIVSMLFAGMGVSASTEMYYKEEQIFDYALSVLENNKRRTEEEVVNILFSRLYILYKHHISKYEIRTESVSVRMGISTYLKFQEIAGDNNTDKFFTMLSKCSPKFEFEK